MQEGNEGLEAEDDEDFVFVLTDEWKEFFAKSEAKRRLGDCHCFYSFLFLLKIFLRIYFLNFANAAQRRNRPRRRAKIRW